ncbi:hypothetical protein [Palleronia sp.]|uniref:hypothetical protein n=1 Tax=Palleronia sp. TaxID=1940284 RepID=UPI0035C802C8
MADQRDPKNTTTTTGTRTGTGTDATHNRANPNTTHNTGKKDSGGIGKWLGIAAAVIILLLLLGWLLGWFAEDTAEIETVNPTVTEEPAVGEDVEVVE